MSLAKQMVLLDIPTRTELELISARDHLLTQMHMATSEKDLKKIMQQAQLVDAALRKVQIKLGVPDLNVRLHNLIGETL